MRLGESKQEHVLEADGYKSLSVVWSSHKNALGDAVEVTTGAAAQSAFVHPSHRADCLLGTLTHVCALRRPVAVAGLGEPCTGPGWANTGTVPHTAPKCLHV